MCRGKLVFQASDRGGNNVFKAQPLYPDPAVSLVGNELCQPEEILIAVRVRRRPPGISTY